MESIFSKEGDWSGLIDAYEQRAAILKDPEKKIETLRRAARVAAAKLKDPDEAARHYESIHLLQPDDAEALDALGTAPRHVCGELNRKAAEALAGLPLEQRLTLIGDQTRALYEPEATKE